MVASAATLRICASPPCSTTICFPLETVRTRMAVSRKGAYSGIADCFRKTVLDKGPGALYRVWEILNSDPGKRFFLHKAPTSWRTMRAAGSAVPLVTIALRRT